ncbi:probable choline kinase 2 [Phragmites australis]|uniref:probable choline kinase 2 n=1 Tax=Phragmites australis TaxID=29695 RepID=UPI002D77A013|nr:probable choline kinase 2 [Phragmites australis]
MAPTTPACWSALPPRLRPLPPASCGGVANVFFSYRYRRLLLHRRAPPLMVAVDPPPREEAEAPALELALKRSGSIDRIPEDARRILHRLAGELWGGGVDPSALAVSQLKGAMTNEVFRITWLGGEGDQLKVLVRIYGQGVEVFFDRADEVRTFEFISRHGQGPRLLGRFANGRVEEFINARTLSAADLRDPEISALIAKKLREFHDLDMPGPKNVSLWQRLGRWLEEARGRCSSEEAREFRLGELGDEIAALENALSGVDQTIGFCHNDLQYGNIMIYEETRQVTLIDYEYASFNPVAFDIANHFCEMAADYHTATPHVLDFTKYPDIDEQRAFVQTYLSASGEKASDKEVEKLLGLIAKYTLASHLFWGLWGIISAHVNKNIDFEYKEYARQRFDQYWQTKPRILGPLCFGG